MQREQLIDLFCPSQGDIIEAHEEQIGGGRVSESWRQEAESSNADTPVSKACLKLSKVPLNSTQRYLRSTTANLRGMGMKSVLILPNSTQRWLRSSIKKARA